MQKNYSQLNRYVRGIHRNIKGNLVLGTIITSIIFIAHLVNGCEPILPNEPKELSNKVDSVQKNKEILPEQEINDWDTDTTTYHTTAQPN